MYLKYEKNGPIYPEGDMRFNRDVEYALISLVAMGSENRKFSARELSEEYTIPYTLLCKILQRLGASGIVTSVQGVNGGYRLAGALDSVTLGDILRSIQGERHVAPCIDEETDCSLEDVCTIRGGIVRVQSMWDDFIRKMTLEDFARNSEPEIPSAHSS